MENDVVCEGCLRLPRLPTNISQLKSLIASGCDLCKDYGAAAIARK